MAKPPNKGTPNGGSVTPATATTAADGKLTSLPTPTRSGSYTLTTFSPDADCTRAQIVTFLYRALADK